MHCDAKMWPGTSWKCAISAYADLNIGTFHTNKKHFVLIFMFTVQKQKAVFLNQNIPRFEIDRIVKPVLWIGSWLECVVTPLIICDGGETSLLDSKSRGNGLATCLSHLSLGGGTRTWDRWQVNELRICYKIQDYATCIPIKFLPFLSKEVFD